MVVVKSPTRTARANRAARRTFAQNLLARRRQAALTRMRRETPLGAQDPTTRQTLAPLGECTKYGDRRNVPSTGRTVRCMTNKHDPHGTLVDAGSLFPSSPAKSCLLFTDGCLPTTKKTDERAKSCFLFTDGILPDVGATADTDTDTNFGLKRRRVAARHALYTVLLERLATGQWMHEPVMTRDVADWVRARYPAWPKMGPNPPQVSRAAVCRAARDQLVALVNQNLMTLAKIPGRR